MYLPCTSCLFDRADIDLVFCFCTPPVLTLAAGVQPPDKESMVFVSAARPQKKQSTTTYVDYRHATPWDTATLARYDFLGAERLTTLQFAGLTLCQLNCISLSKPRRQFLSIPCCLTSSCTSPFPFPFPSARRKPSPPPPSPRLPHPHPLARYSPPPPPPPRFSTSRISTSW